MLKALFSRIVVEPIEEETYGGLIVKADGYDRGAKMYRIVDCGPEAGKVNGREVNNFKPGDIILCHQGKVMLATFRGKKYYTIPDAEVIGLWKEGK